MEAMGPHFLRRYSPLTTSAPPKESARMHFHALGMISNYPESQASLRKSPAPAMTTIAPRMA